MRMFLKIANSESYKNGARTMDWVLAWLSIPFAGWMVWRSYPHIDLWAWLCIAAIPLSFALAKYDWQKMFSDWLHKVLFRTRR